MIKISKVTPKRVADEQLFSSVEISAVLTPASVPEGFAVQRAGMRGSSRKCGHSGDLLIECQKISLA